MKCLMKASLFGLLLPALLNAQEVGLLRLNPERPARETKVAVTGGVEEGWFRPTYAGTFQWSAGARAEGVRHGEKTTWMGSVSLGHMMGYRMLSSMLVSVMQASRGRRPRLMRHDSLIICLRTSYDRLCSSPVVPSTKSP